MKAKFNPKQFQGKKRIYQSAGNNIQRLYVWNGEQYAPPAQGAAFYARRKYQGKYQYRFLDTLAEARAWQRGEPEPALIADTESRESGLPMDQLKLVG